MAQQSSPDYEDGSPALPNVRGFSRRQYHELHPKDQAVKQSKKLQIEANWGVDIKDVLPPHIRPRCELKKGSKARIGDVGVAEETWWNWSVELLKCIEELSSMTVNNVKYGRELLEIEVRLRQENPKSAQRKILELLLGDAQRVVDETRKQANKHAAMASSQRRIEAEDDANGMDYEVEPHQVSRKRRIAEIPDQDHEVNYGDESYVANGATNNGFSPNTIDKNYAMRPAQRRKINNQILETLPNPYLTIGNSLKTTELKARAARLKAEATRLEAQATQLELEASELREAIESIEDIEGSEGAEDGECVGGVQGVQGVEDVESFGD